MDVIIRERRPPLLNPFRRSDWVTLVILPGMRIDLNFGALQTCLDDLLFSHARNEVIVIDAERGVNEGLQHINFSPSPVYY